MTDLGAILFAAISLPVKPFLCNAMMTACQVTMVDRGRTMIPSTSLLLKLPVCYSNSISMTVISSFSSSTLTPVLTRESLTCQLVLLWQDSNAVEFFLGGIQFICMAKRDIAIHLFTLHNILEYMQIAIIQTEAADLVKISICVSKLLATTVQ